MLSSRSTFLLFIALAIVFVAITPTRAQSGRSNASEAPQSEPTPLAREPEQIRIFTEEVRLPIFVTDDYGRFDPTIEMPDILVIEDDEMQEVKSVRRIPANVLLVLDTSGGINPMMRTNTTRDLALSLIKSLKTGDDVAIVQAGDRVEVLQDWTSDREALQRTLKTKLSSGRKKRISAALIEAASRIKNRPAGSRHIVLITDGVEPNDKSYAEAVRQLNAAQATVYVISYTAMGREGIKKIGSPVTFGGAPPRTANDVAKEADPTIPCAASQRQHRHHRHGPRDAAQAQRVCRSDYQERRAFDQTRRRNGRSNLAAPHGRRDAQRRPRSGARHRRAVRRDVQTETPALDFASGRIPPRQGSAPASRSDGALALRLHSPGSAVTQETNARA